MKQETKNKLTYKVVCNLNDMDYYTDNKQDAIDTFEQYKEDYGDGIRLYEAETPEEDDEAPEWETIDYYDEDEPKDESKEVKEGGELFSKEWYVINGEDDSDLFPSVVMGEHNEGFYKKPRIIINETPTAKKGTHSIAAKAICTAVNNTYGKGLNPESCLPMFNALSAILDGIKTKNKDLNIGSIKVLCETILETAKTIKP